MWVRAGGQWLRGRVMARQDWAGAGPVYQIAVPTPSLSYRIVSYRWPQPGLVAETPPARDTEDQR